MSQSTHRGINACMIYFIHLIFKEVFNFGTSLLPLLVSCNSYSYWPRIPCSSSSLKTHKTPHFPQIVGHLLSFFKLFFLPAFQTPMNVKSIGLTNWPRWQNNGASDFKLPQTQRWQIPHQNKYHSANVRFALGLILYKYWVPRWGGGGDWALPLRWQISRRVFVCHLPRDSWSLRFATQFIKTGVLIEHASIEHEASHWIYPTNWLMFWMLAKACFFSFLFYFILLINSIVS